jgi:hypothetical protein
MKLRVTKLSEAEVLSRYPIAGQLDGWYFRLEETSNNYWRAEATDLWGRKVACGGSDEDALLRECVAMARSIVAAK